MSYNNNSCSLIPPPAIPENPPTPRKPPRESRSSLLLSRDENQMIFDILGKGCQTLATAVIQLLVPTPDQSRWQVKEAGVACLVRDTTKRSYFIQVFNLGTKNMVFEQEIYNQFEYDMPNHCFLTFEGDITTVGVTFADPTEAGLFREGLDKKLEAKRQRRNERDHQRQVADKNHYPQSQSHVENPGKPTTSESTVSTTTTYNFPTSMPKRKTKRGMGKGKDKFLRKEDIGQPTNFRHVAGVGWDNHLNLLCEKAGVSSDALDKNTQKFIVNFVKENGGLESIRNSRQSTPPQLVPSNAALSNRTKLPARPPPPNFSNTPISSQSNAPIPPRPPPMSGHGVPPPPPPPPMAIAMGFNNQQSDDSVPRSKAMKPSLPPVIDDRTNLLAQIQKGVQLKKTDAAESPTKRAGEPPTTDKMDGLAGALSRALAERSKAVNPISSSEDEEEEQDEDDWD